MALTVLERKDQRSSFILENGGWCANNLYKNEKKKKTFLNVIPL